MGDIATTGSEGNYQWNYGDILDALADVVPGDRPALIHGDDVTHWEDFTKRTNNLAANLLKGGAVAGDKIAIYMRNRREYPEGLAASFKGRLTHVNVNYRYVAKELVYLMDNADATVCIYAAEFASHVSAIKDSLPKVTQWVEVADGFSGNDDAISYEALATEGDGKPLGIERFGSDQLFLYTGGTTGMPKGVMWAHHSLWNALGGGGNANAGVPPCDGLEDLLARIRHAPTVPVNVPLPPIMHGTGMMSEIGRAHV